MTEIIHCKTKADIKKLVDDWAITWEGLDTSEENLKQLFDWVSQYTKVLNQKVYVVSGALMNRSYRLVGDNRYPADLNIVSIMSEDLENKNSLSVPRLKVGGRWMYDIVEDNKRWKK